MRLDEFSKYTLNIPQVNSMKDIRKTRKIDRILTKAKFELASNPSLPTIRKSMVDQISERREIAQLPVALKTKRNI